MPKGLPVSLTSHPKRRPAWCSSSLKTTRSHSRSSVLQDMNKTPRLQDSKTPRPTKFVQDQAATAPGTTGTAVNSLVVHWLTTISAQRITRLWKTTKRLMNSIIAVQLKRQTEKCLNLQSVHNQRQLHLLSTANSTGETCSFYPRAQQRVVKDRNPKS